MRVVITGATGNLGTSVLARLGDEPSVHEIVGLARRVPSSTFAKTRFLAIDVSREPLTRHFEGADAVIHLAWQIRSAHDVRELDRVNIQGSARVFAAAAEAGAKTLIHASSVGTYSPSDKREPRAESWPAAGVPGSNYSRQKAEVEAILDDYVLRHPSIRVVRMRPALIFKRAAASHIQELFIGRLVPRFLFQQKYLRYVIDHPAFRFQAVHADDVARAFVLALTSDARGAFNVAADPVLDTEVLAGALSARKVRLSPGILRKLVATAFRARLVPLEPGWVDLCFQSPLLDASRARQNLGWEPAHSSLNALFELLDGLRDGAKFDTPPLRAERLTPRAGH